MATRTARIDEKLEQRMFNDDDVRALLNEMTVSEVIAKLGHGDEYVTYATAQGWKVGDERPALADDDPAVQQAIGRCASTRRTVKGLAFAIPSSVHPQTCGWCGYPLEELLKACAWAVHQSGSIEAHVMSWKDEQGRTYARPYGDSGYRNKAHRAFWDLPAKERERRITAAQRVDQDEAWSDEVNRMIEEESHD